MYTYQRMGSLIKIPPMCLSKHVGNNYQWQLPRYA